MDAFSFDTAINNIGADIARRAITEAIHIVEVAFGSAVERAFGGVDPAKREETPVKPTRRGRGKSRPDVRAAITEALKANPNASDAEVMAVAPSVNRSTITRARRSLGILRRVGVGGRVADPANADRRNRIGAAMTANPDASNKAIAAMLGIEHCSAFENDATRVRRKLGLHPRSRGGTRWEPVPVAPPTVVEIEIPGVRATDMQDLTGTP